MPTLIAAAMNPPDTTACLGDTNATFDISFQPTLQSDPLPFREPARLVHLWGLIVPSTITEGTSLTSAR